MAAGNGWGLLRERPVVETSGIASSASLDDLDMTTDTRFRVFANFYKDSVALMQVGAALRKRPGIVEASCVMATPANLEQLANAKLSVHANVNPSDLLVVVRGDTQACDEALDAAQALLQSEPTGGGEREAFSIPLTSIAAAVDQAADADLALISVPGDYAAAEAMKALSLGLHVMLFSDNVSVDQEIAIKRHAEARGLLVMGPDCGTAIINGIPLGFANVVRRGSVGLVAASGTGLQEVTCRIHNLGAGVSQAIGTGGRDLRDEIGGLTMLAGLRALAGDDQTRVIVLVSKPPSPTVASRILALAGASGKPTVVHFLGAEPGTVSGAGLHAARSLADAADIAVALADLLGDIMVYCRSEALKYGLPLEEVLDVIMDSNESKLGPDGNPIYDANGKFLKGPNYWKPEPRIKALLEARGVEVARDPGSSAPA